MKKSSLIWILPLLVFSVWFYFQRGPGLPPPGPYVTSGSDTAPLEELLERSRAESKPVVLLFTGSTWCPPCKQLARSVFEKPEWQEFVRGEIIFVVYDFPRIQDNAPESQHRNQMAERFAVEGFPELFVLDEAGRVRAKRFGYEGGGPQDYIDWVRR